MKKDMTRRERDEWVGVGLLALWLLFLSAWEFWVWR